MVLQHEIIIIPDFNDALETISHCKNLKLLDETESKWELGKLRAYHPLLLVPLELKPSNNNNNNSNSNGRMSNEMTTMAWLWHRTTTKCVYVRLWAKLVIETKTIEIMREKKNGTLQNMETKRVESTEMVNFIYVKLWIWQGELQM